MAECLGGVFPQEVTRRWSMFVRGGGQKKKLSFLLWEALATTSGGRVGPLTQGVPSADLADGAGGLPRGRGAGTLPGAEPDPQRPMRSPLGAGRKGEERFSHAHVNFIIFVPSRAVSRPRRRALSTRRWVSTCLRGVASFDSPVAKKKNLTYKTSNRQEM